MHDYFISYGFDKVKIHKLIIKKEPQHFCEVICLSNFRPSISKNIIVMKSNKIFQIINFNDIKLYPARQWLSALIILIQNRVQCTMPFCFL
jgi:hypothetical protein